MNGLVVLGLVSALLLGVQKLSILREPRRAGSRRRGRKSDIVTLQEVLMHHSSLPPGAQEFYEALLAQGEVLAAKVAYLPDSLLWLTTTAAQAHWIRERHKRATGSDCAVMSAADARELLTAIGDQAPPTLREMAQVLTSHAPAESRTRTDAS